MNEALYKQLEELNYKQAAILMEYFQCYRVVGGTVYLDAIKLKHLILERHHERKTQDGNVERRSLRTSKYL